jgi:hypothetical protein
MAHGVRERTVAELESSFAYDQIPTRDLQATQPGTKLNLLAHNINVDFQSASCNARGRAPRSAHRPSLSSIRAARFEWLNHAAPLIAPGGSQTLGSPPIPPSRMHSRRVRPSLDQAA